MKTEDACLPLNIIHGAPNGKYELTASVIIKGEEIYFDNQSLTEIKPRTDLIFLLIFALVFGLVLAWFNRPSK